jgi:hypothetical protein
VIGVFVQSVQAFLASMWCCKLPSFATMPQACATHAAGVVLSCR